MYVSLKKIENAITLELTTAEVSYLVFALLDGQTARVLGGDVEVLCWR